MQKENDRIKEIRKALKMSQEGFGDAIGLTKSSISNIENGIRNVTDQHTRLLHSEFNVSEDWLRHGTGDMFVQQAEFSLDEYAEKNKISPLEIDIIKSYMEVDASIRKGIMSHFKTVFERHNETAATVVDPVEAELESYRCELEAEQKGATLSALGEQSDKESS